MPASIGDAPATPATVSVKLRNNRGGLVASGELSGILIEPGKPWVVPLAAEHVPRTTTLTAEIAVHGTTGLRLVAHYGRPATSVVTPANDGLRLVYAAENVIISAAGNLEHSQLREALDKAFGSMPASGSRQNGGPPTVIPKVVIRNKDLEQSHVCLGASSYPQNHSDRYASYVMNTMLGGSMSSRLFQNIREKRGLAYSVFSGINAYRDAGYLTVYAGCANDAVGQVVDLIVEEMKGIKQTPVPDSELRRAKDHLKGSVMLSLENTSSRMSHLARQEIYFDRQFSLDETLEGIERVTPGDVQRVAGELFSNGSLAATVLGQVNGLQLPRERLDLN